MDYESFLKELDIKLADYFNEYKDFICCKVGCSYCCEKGDYPLSDIELRYIMKGYIELDNTTKQAVQKNIKNMKQGESCPFLLDKKCSIYPFRPIICRVHGLAYFCNENIVKVPHCTNIGKNYAKVYSGGEILIEPINENLDTINILNEFITKNQFISSDSSKTTFEIRNLFDWLT